MALKNLINLVIIILIRMQPFNWFVELMGFMVEFNNYYSYQVNQYYYCCLVKMVRDFNQNFDWNFIQVINKEGGYYMYYGFHKAFEGYIKVVDLDTGACYQNMELAIIKIMFKLNRIAVTINKEIIVVIIKRDIIDFID